MSDLKTIRLVKKIKNLDIHVNVCTYVKGV